MRSLMSASLSAMLVLGAPLTLSAQEGSSGDLADLLPGLILRDITLPRAATSGVVHVAHFSPIESDNLNNPAVGIVRSFNQSMMMQLSTYPLGSSAGGFTYTFDESLGTFRRASTSFGPSFAERAVTIGRHKVNVGFVYQQSRYDRFEGHDLDDGSIKFYLRHEDCCRSGGGQGSGSSGGQGSGGGGGGGVVGTPNGTRLDPPFEGDLIEAALSLKARTDTAAFSVNFGVTDRWDVGLLVPLVRVDLDADVRATIVRLATANDPLTHTFETGDPDATQKTFRQSGTASGLGDTVVRTKYRVLGLSGGGLAAGLDVRLPTGDQNNLLGAGGQIKPFLIVSGGNSRLLEHVNIGYTSTWGEVPNRGLRSSLGVDTSLPDEINYAAGVEFVAESRLTIVGDIIGRSLRNAGRLSLINKSFEFTRSGTRDAQGRLAVQTAAFDEFEPRAGSLNLTLATVGFKFNPVRDFLVSASVLFPLSDAGLRSRLTPVIGVDYAF